MRPGTDKLLGKAERTLEAARAALDTGAVEAAAGRAYYAMLYGAKALLNEHGLRLRAHARVVAALDRHCPGDAALVACLRDAASRRGSPSEDDLPYEDAATLAEHARAFLEWARRRVAEFG